MAFKLSELLNPAPNANPLSPTHHQKPSSSPQQQSSIFSPIDSTTPRHLRHNSYSNYGSSNSNRDLVDSYPHQQHHHQQDPQRHEDSGYDRDFSQKQHSRGHARTYSGPPALTNYGLPATPVEPSPPQSARPPFSPTLDQYHHPSRSPVLETKSSWPRTTSPPPILAPIKVSPVIPREQFASTTSPTHIQDFRAHSSDPRSPLSPATTRRTASNDEMDDIQYHEVKNEELGFPQNSSFAIQQPISPHAPTPASASSDGAKISPRLRVTTEVAAIHPETSFIPAPIKYSPEERPPSRTPPPDAPSPKATVGPASTREESSMNPPSNASTPVPDTPLQATSSANTKSTKKRAAPKSAPASSKKGTASLVKKPQKKKRKLDTDSVDDVNSARSSVAPVSSRASKTNARKQSSTPAARGASSSPAPDDEYEDGAELYCICRRPDSHTWMIGCDGGCEDWFHGACVKIKEEDGDLIDKYICPNCEKEGKGVTTWKPMCRLEGCRRPARLSKKDLSKYCSDAHGREFMMGFTKKKRKRDDDSSDESSDSPGRSIYVGGSGGALSKGQLAAVTKTAKDVGEFRRLGEGVLSPPPTLSPDDGDADGSGQPIIYNGDERKRLSEIATEKDELASRRQGLNDREKFLQLTKERAKAVMEELGMKQMCGFDSRLSWSEEEFLQWRDRFEGRKALLDQFLGPPTTDGGGDRDMDENERTGVGVCQKKRCERHGTWKTYQLQDIRHEEVSIAEKMGMLKQEEKDIRERAKLRTIKESEGDREGRVEIVDDDDESD